MLVLSNVRPEAGKDGAKSPAKFTLDSGVVEQASARVRQLLSQFPLYPELDLDLMLDAIGT